VDFSGISKRGYEAEGLCRVLVKELGADEVWQTVVVGAGNLGAALALHEDFGRHGFCICGVFDVDAKKIGRRLGRLAVQSLRDLPAVIGEKKVDVGIIAVPSQAAQSVADLMIASGIRGLLNLTLTHIVAPKRVAVVDARIVASLQELAHAIKMKRGG
jgi:redox-sensing transcriptional repressor